MAILSTLFADFSKTYQYDLVLENRMEKKFIWKMERSRPFEELILSWNGQRPEIGKWVFWVSVRQEGADSEMSGGHFGMGEWSPWIKYAEWASHSQKTFKYAAEGCNVESYQDAVYPKDGQCEAFKIKATAEDGADLKRLESLYVCVSALSKHKTEMPEKPLQSITLANVPRQSQMKLDHPRSSDLCSPTSITTAINYLLGARKSDPVAFAAKIHDDEFDIYGNWILNTAQGYQELGGKFGCHVERLPSFSTLHSYLMRGLPVVVSLRGPLPGSFTPLTFGHLICVIGYNADTQKVLCIDSGFPENEETSVSYALKDFLDAWARRQNIAYIFTPKNLESTLEKMMR